MASIETGKSDRAGRALHGTRWYAAADTIVFAGVLNLLVVVFTLAGGVVLGWAPALAAATACTRRRLRGDAGAVVRTFARTWSRGFAHANLLLAPPGVALALCATSLLALRDRPGATPLVVALWIALGICGAHLVLTLTMDAHYELGRRQCLRLAWTFLLRFPGAPLLLVATTALVVVATMLVPGLLPVLSVGAWISLCTALCLSFYAANDRALDGGRQPRPVHPTSIQ